MARPQKHRRTGGYYFRRRVPDKIRRLVGMTELVRSLDTKNPEIAKLKYVEMAREVDREWARLKDIVDVAELKRERIDNYPPPLPEKPAALSDKQVLGLAGEFYRWFVAQHEENPGEPERWREEIAKDMRWSRPSGGRPSAAVSRVLDRMKEFLVEKGVVVSEDDIWRLALATSKAGGIAHERLVRMAEEDYSEDAAGQRFPKWNEVEPKLTIPSKRLTLETHFETYAKKKAIATRQKYRGCLQELVRFLNTRDLGSATPEKLDEWRDSLVKRELGDRTIKDGYLAAARSFYRWAVKQKHIRMNPASELTIEVEEAVHGRVPYLVDEEANCILAETLRPHVGRGTAEWIAAVRWLPWLLAFTGARINELTQLRGQDVSKQTLRGEDVWVITITPDAGPVKNKRPRDIPLHPQIVEQGFPEFVMGRGPGPLFYDLSRRRGGSEENHPSQKVGENLAAWVRKNCNGDKRISPNHAWRHRFNQVARSVEMIPEIRDAVLGHKPRTEGEKYGGYIDWKLMWPQIKLLPRYDVRMPTEPRKPSAAKTKATKARAATRKRAKERAKAEKASVSGVETEAE